MTIHRRGFLTGLASLFGVANAAELNALVQDFGRPILLPVSQPALRLHVYEGGCLTLGPYADNFDMPRPTWRQQFAEEGVDVGNPAALARYMRERSFDPDELDVPVQDVCWPMAYSFVWCPAARAYNLLRRLKVGTTVRAGGRLGHLIFHEGDNHPGSNDLWVDAEDDLSVSCLQARLIELGQPVEIVMECATVRRDDYD